MESFIIEGGRPLRGTITPQGAKNEALEVIAAVLLTPDPVRITNIPDILDVNNLIRLLQDVGVKVMRNGKGDFTFQADELNLEFLASDEYVKKCAALRGSVLMMGPLLAQRQYITQPANRISSSYATCSTLWEPISPALLLTCSPSWVWRSCMEPHTASCQT